MRPRAPLRALSPVALALLALSSCHSTASGGRDHQPATRELMELLDERPDLERMLERSIAEAKAQNPDRLTNPVQSLEEYYDFLDRACQLIPQDVLANPEDLTREQILQSICYFYFLVDQPLKELDGTGLFRDRIQYEPAFSRWLRSFADSWGDFLDTAESWNERVYQQFAGDPGFGLQKGWYESPGSWRTFNQFFSRKLASPAMRPIASPGDAAVVSSPADSVPQGTWAIDADSRIRVEDGLQVKLARYFSVEQLLGEGNPYAGEFANGVLTHTFLNVNDYHRYHFPVGGTVKDVRKISENVALEVTWDGAAGRYDPIDSTGWQFTQTRGVVVVDTGTHGLVALIPMGMAQVSSVQFDASIAVGSTHVKGSELGWFLFGGSDFVMLFQERAGFELTAQPTPGSAPVTYDHVLMGEEYGKLRGGG